MTGRTWRVLATGASGPGALVELSEEESHHVARVLRLREGEVVGVFDGEGREWSGSLLSVGSRVTVLLGDEKRGGVDPTLPVALWQGLCRPERMDWLVQKGTELGMSSLTPFHAGRSEVGRLSPSRIDRLRRIALEACKQSGRRILPRIGDLVPLPPQTPGGFEAWLLHPGPGSEPIARRLARRRPEGVWIAVGPEGGFTGEEAGILNAAGWSPCSLGPRVLRTETAGPVALALALYAWDDLGSVGS
jgi:16S rRNA (uracil1498-N3)-methyltransferase